MPREISRDIARKHAFLRVLFGFHKKPQKSDTIWSLGGKALGAADSDTSVSFKQRAEAYLLSIGVSQKDIDDLRTLMLE